MKKLFCMLLVGLTTCIFASSAFASQEVPINATPLYNMSYKAFMNCAGNKTYNYNNRNVDIYYRVESGTDQTWQFVMLYPEQYFYIISGTSDAIGNRYALNIYRYNNNYGNCDVMQLRGNEKDATIDVNGSLEYYEICSLQHYFYPSYFVGVQAGNGALGYDVRWMTGGSHLDPVFQWQHWKD